MSYDRVHFLCSRLYTKQYMCGIKINNCKKMSKNWEKKVDRAVSLCLFFYKIKQKIHQLGRDFAYLPFGKRGIYG